MNSPLVSIVVVTYNQEVHIKDCLDGILMQQVNFPYEILVGDDCSTDNTPKVVRQYHKCFPNIKLIQPQNNVFSTGDDVFHALIRQQAKGKYIAFCDGDDYWIYGEKLQKQVDFLETHCEYSMCFHDHQIKIEGSRIAKHYKLRKDCDVRLNELLNMCVCQTSAIVGRLDSLKIGQVDSYFIHPSHTYSDINYYMAWFATGKIHHITGEWSVYRLHDKGITAKDYPDQAAQIKHDIGLSAIISCYGEQYKYIKRNHRSCTLLNKSSHLAKKRLYISSIILKIGAFAISPRFVARLYLKK